MSEKQPEEKPNPNLQRILEAIAQSDKERDKRLEEIEKKIGSRTPEKKAPPMEATEHRATDGDSSNSASDSVPTASVIVGHLKECPECAEKVLKEVYGVEPDAECVNCGRKIRHEQHECPSCKGTKARNL